MSQIDSLPPLSQVIRDHDLQAKRQLGQNFLLDLNLTAKIARLAGDIKNADIFEVGPGPGGLTRGLLAEGARKVLVVEKDTRCIPALQEISQAYPNHLQIIEGDALKINPSEYLSSPIRIVANLPYNVGTELLIRWLSPQQWPPPWKSLTLMFQKEVAQRIVATPGSTHYGRLAIFTQWRSKAQIVMTLPPEAFTPAPKVYSAVVHLEIREQPLYPANSALLERITAMAFNQRRKMLRAALKPLAAQIGCNIESLLESASIQPTQRAENINIESFCRLAREVEKRQKNLL